MRTAPFFIFWQIQHTSLIALPQRNPLFVTKMTGTSSRNCLAPPRRPAPAAVTDRTGHQNPCTSNAHSNSTISSPPWHHDDPQDHHSTHATQRSPHTVGPRATRDHQWRPSDSFAASSTRTHQRSGASMEADTMDYSACSCQQDSTPTSPPTRVSSSPKMAPTSPNSKAKALRLKN